MSVSLHKIHKWTLMLLGKSQQHVKQNEGRCYSIHEIKGYYNDLTEKITRYGIDREKIPITKHDNGTTGYFSIEIFQYGLAAYDLFLMERSKDNLIRFNNCVKWAIDHQEESGAWETFYLQNSESPYSAMAQGEGASLLIRAYLLTKDKQYLYAAGRAIKFMLIPIEEGGTALYVGNGIILYEFTYLPPVFNGWIFASWGLWDYYKITKDENIKDIWQRTMNALVNCLDKFDNGFWSNYNLNGAIASNHYHRIHIAQLSVLSKITEIEAFTNLYLKFKKYPLHSSNKIKAFVIKVYQKLKEK